MWYSHHLPSRLPLQKRKAGVVEVHLEQPTHAWTGSSKGIVRLAPIAC